MRKIKIGTTVTAKLFGEEIVTGKIEHIEICKVGEKYGRPVNSCDIDKHSNGTVCLDCNRWCYFDQIIKIEK